MAACEAPPPRPASGWPDFALAYERASPAVVGVVAGKLEGGRFRPLQQGSGLIWDDAGHVVTNDHLLNGATHVQIFDSVRHDAQIVGRDPRTDVAVLEAGALRLGDLKLERLRGAPPEAALRPGQWVAAIGNPYGMARSISVGVVSAVHRRNALPGGAPMYRDFIQTDVSINPGNSGGPLVDGRGRVVGLTTAVLSQGQGLGFATPIEMVTTVVGQILQHGRFIRGFAGLYARPVTMKAAEAANLERPVGARVGGVLRGGPADRAGLRPGDIILRFHQTPIHDDRVLAWLIASTKPGTLAEVQVARQDERLTLTVPIEEAAP